MILPIIFLCLIILSVTILILFLFYILFPSINKNSNEITEDPLISNEEFQYQGENDEPVEVSNYKAVVLCNCNKEMKSSKLIYNKEYTCALIKNQRGTGNDCKFSCIGLGDCLKKCPQNAIIIRNNTAFVTSQCAGCGQCVDTCPQGIIKLIPDNTKNYILCANEEDSITTCNQQKNLVNLETIEKKDFKIWSYCYKILKRFK